MSAVFPELVHGRHDGFTQGPWVVQAGVAHRGGAHCNLSQRTLHVPLGDDQVSRVIQAHELMHIRVSPYLSEHARVDIDISERALECAEEFRVNLLLNRLGFGVSQLLDGTEKLGGQRLAREENWAEAVCFLLAVLGTGSETHYISGVRSQRPSWAAALRAIKKRVYAIVDPLSTAHIGDTSLDDEGLAVGFSQVTAAVARVVSRSMGAAPPNGVDELKVFRRSLEPGARRAPSGTFAPLMFDDTISYVVRAQRGGHRRQRASTSGTTLRYPSRLLTDPYQRAFSTRAPSAGGVIVIDQSGSMDVTVEELQRVLSEAPNATVVGYSHRPGDLGQTPNAWILIRAGRVASQARSGNIGNGVDGPVLRWAIRQSQGRGPVVWVTDGQVTDSQDHPCHRLSVECALMVQRHQIRMVRNLNEVQVALRGHRVSKDSFGRVGRELLVLGR
jgi:hypothetical protein